MNSTLRNPSAKLKIGWALVRVSTKSQAEVQHGSLEQQRHMLERWSSQQSESSGQPYQITRFFEEDISGRGKAIHKRMALMEIERAIESKTIDFIVFEKVDRLARDMIYNLGLVKKAHEYGVEVHEFESGQIDLKDRGSRLGFNIKNLLAEEYSLDLEEKIAKKQREARFNNGKDTSTCAVLGLDPHPSKRGMYVINKKEQTIVIDIFKKFIDCGSVMETSKYCIEKGYRNKTRMTKEKVDKDGNIVPPREVGGEPFLPKRVRYLLSCQKIRGYGFFKDTWNQFRKEQDENGMVRWDYSHGAVVPLELFEEAQRVLVKNQKFNGRTRGAVYLLTGILEHEDGTKLSGAGAGGRNSHYEYYHCRKHNLRVPKEEIEALIVKRIKEYMKSSELLNKLLADVRPMADMGIPLLKEEISQIKAKIAENQKVIDGFSNYLRQSALNSPTNLENVIRTIGMERDRAETEIQLMERELVNKENRLRELSSDQQGKGLKDYLEQVLETFDSQGDSKKREIIQTIIPRIQVVPKNKLRLHIRTDFRSGNSGAKNSTADFGQGVASYLSPTGLEQKGTNLILSGVTSGGNFSSRDKLAGPSIAGRKVSSMNSPDIQTCDTIDFIFECLWKDKDFLQQKYVVEGLSIAQISEQILSSREAVRMGLIEHGIKRKSRGAVGSKVAQVPYGYRRSNGALVPHLGEQRVIQSAKKMSSDGLSYRRICEFLTSVGVPTKNKGRGWQPEMVRRMLTRSISV